MNIFNVTANFLKKIKIFTILTTFNNFKHFFLQLDIIFASKSLK